MVFVEPWESTSFKSTAGVLPKRSLRKFLLTSESHSQMDGVNLIWKIQSSFESLRCMDFCFESNGQKSVSEVPLSISSPCKLCIL